VLFLPQYRQLGNRPDGHAAADSHTGSYRHTGADDDSRLNGDTGSNVHAAAHGYGIPDADRESCADSRAA
jgi:hypothetical protein